jgi:D-tyrosyl-tRNA(Tyr) deacylase
VRAVLQRVSSAHVETGGRIVGRIGNGLLVLVGFEDLDSEGDLSWMSSKLLRLRIFPDASGVMNRSVLDVRGEILLVSQFTLFASVKKGNRPSWNRASTPDVSRPLFESFVRRVESDFGAPVPSGIFGADMRVHLINDGPVTLCVDSKKPG